MFDYIFEAYYEARDELLTQMQADGTLELPAIDDSMSKEEKIAVFAECFQIAEKICGPEPQVSERAGQIMRSGWQIEQEIYDADSHPIDEMPAVQEVIQETADTGWETQGEILQENSYEGVTLLLLQYFDGRLF
jgi:hypothetical protein